jgi:hypothetical protein
MIDAHNLRHRDLIVLRLINPHGLGARRARLVMVQRFHLTAGDWLCTVRYHDKREARGGRLCRSNCGRLIFDSSQL